LFQPHRAIAIAAGPWFGAIAVTAVAAIVRVLNARELKILLPITTLFVQGLVAIANLHPASGSVITQTCLLHVAKIFVARHGAASQRAAVDGV
jgi:hypothetical protein